MKRKSIIILSFSSLLFSCFKTQSMDIQNISIPLPLAAASALGVYGAYKGYKEYKFEKKYKTGKFFRNVNQSCSNKVIFNKKDVI